MSNKSNMINMISYVDDVKENATREIQY